MMVSRILVRNNFFTREDREKLRCRFQGRDFFSKGCRSKAEYSDTNIREVIFLDSTEIPADIIDICIGRCQRLQDMGCTMLRHIDLDTIHRMQVTKYSCRTSEPELADGSLNFHLDGNEGQTDILSFVATLKSVDCKGGDLIYCDTDDGKISSRSHRILKLEDNLAYVIPGAQVLHGVTPIVFGVRYAVVVFFGTILTKGKILLMWNWPNKVTVVCLGCHRLFKSEKPFHYHSKRCHGCRKRRGEGGKHNYEYMPLRCWKGNR